MKPGLTSCSSKYSPTSLSSSLAEVCGGAQSTPFSLHCTRQNPFNWRHKVQLAHDMEAGIVLFEYTDHRVLCTQQNGGNSECDLAQCAIELMT